MRRFWQLSAPLFDVDDTPGTEGVQSNNEPAQSPEDAVRAALETGTPPPAETPPDDSKPPETPPAETPPDDKLTRVQDDLARRDRELYAREAALKAQEVELNRWRELQGKANDDPLTVVRQLGIDPMSLAEKMLGGDGEPKQPTAQDALSRIEALEKQLQEERQERAQGNEIASIQRAVTTATDRFPVLSTLSEEGDTIARDAFQRATKYHADTGRVPDYGNMLETMEKEYTERIFSSIDRLSKLPSVREKLTGLLSAQPEKPLAQQNPPPQGQPPQTLTQDMKQPPSTEERTLTEEEKEALVIKMLQGEKPGA